MAVTEKEVYDALVAAGFSRSQAAGIMGNIQNESGFNPEAVNPGGPTAGVGLVQWETTYYPQAAGYVTGNSAKDLADQIKGIVSEAHHLNLTGTAGQVAGTWAADFEKCQGCQPGGDQYNARVANANRIYQQAVSGRWPSKPGPGISGSGSSSAAPAQAQLTAAAGSSLLGPAQSLLHGVAVVLDRAFAMFAPGQGWRVVFGAAALLLAFLSFKAFTGGAVLG